MSAFGLDGRRVSPYLMFLPALIFLLLFVYLPAFENVYLSLFRWSAIQPGMDYVGLGQYRRLLADPLFWKSIVNNVWYGIISVAVQVYFALVLAAVLESGMVGKRSSVVFRTIYFLPCLLASTIVGLTWKLLYRPQVGLINQLLNAAGLSSLTRAWLGEEATAIFAVIAVSQWQWTGYMAMMFIVAIQAIPKELYEAALIDGANWIQQFFHITMPSVRQTTLVMLVITLVGAVQVFDIVWVMTVGGPNRASEVLGNYMYRSGFRNDEMGYASALATVMFLISFVLAVMQLRLGRTEKEV